MERKFATVERSDGVPTDVRIDDVPQDTVARSPDDALKAAQLIQSVSNEQDGQLGFKIEYQAD